MSIREAIKRIAPRWLVALRRQIQRRSMQRAYAGKSAQEVFSDIYAHARWGGEKGQFFSGDGSIPAHVLGYAGAVSGLLEAEGARSLVDIGCGDFTIGSALAAKVDRYVGVDVVSALIERNQKEFGTDSVSFHCLDAASDPLPAADACTIRQVLQHLSNAQIAAILAKTAQYRLVIISEHYPARLTAPNLDKPQGMDTRVADGSAVVLTEAPFSIAKADLLYEAPENPDEPGNGEMIKTFVIRNAVSSEMATDPDARAA